MFQQKPWVIALLWLTVLPGSFFRKEELRFKIQKQNLDPKWYSMYKIDVQLMYKYISLVKNQQSPEYLTSILIGFRGTKQI